MRFNPHPAAVEALSGPVVPKGKPKQESGDAENQKITKSTQSPLKDSYFTINKEIKLLQPRNVSSVLHPRGV